MQYLGGKSRIRKQIAAYLESVRKPDQVYFEPFVGGAWVLQEMSGSRIASDGNDDLVTMYKALQEGWNPPEYISEDTYKYYQHNHHKHIGDPLVAFIGIGCSFSGKWFGGYARSGDRNYASNARNSLLKKKPLLDGVVFEYGRFEDHTPCELLVYCDPPYSGTTKYTGVEVFDSDLFWDTTREWSKDNTVIISEYNAPPDFECILEIDTKLDMHTTGKSNKRVEKLFRLKS